MFERKWTILGIRPALFFLLIATGAIAYIAFKSWIVTGAALVTIAVLWCIALTINGRIKSRPLRRLLNDAGQPSAYDNESAPYTGGYAWYEGNHQRVGVAILSEGIHVGALWFCNVQIPWGEIRNLKPIDNGRWVELALKELPDKKIILPWKPTFEPPRDVWVIE